jgi:hypothetical protein
MCTDVGPIARSPTHCPTGRFVTGKCATCVLSDRREALGLTRSERPDLPMRSESPEFSGVDGDALGTPLTRDPTQRLASFPIFYQIICVRYAVSDELETMTTTAISLPRPMRSVTPPPTHTVAEPQPKD